MCIDRTAKFAYAELLPRAGKTGAAQFLRFTDRKQGRRAFAHIFDRVCREHDTEHRLTKPGHPWTNGQVERINRTVKDTTVRRYYYATHRQLREPPYNFAKRRKTPRGLTPCQ